MSTVLTNGIIIPDNGSRNWGGDLANNWNILDVNVGYMTDVKNSVTTLETSVAENTANIQTNTSNISALQTSKQDVIEDLETIRTGASSGATAVQPSDLTSKANDSDVVHKSGNETIAGSKTFSNIITSNKELNYRDTTCDWSDTSLNRWFDTGHVTWLDRTGARRIHELVGGTNGIWQKACYINENNYFVVDSNRNIRFEGNSFKWNGKKLACAYDTTMTTSVLHVGSVLTSSAKAVSFVVPINVDGSPTVSFTRLRLRSNGYYLFGSTGNSDVTTSYTFTSTVFNGGINFVINFSETDTNAINNSCIVSEIQLKLTY